MTGDEEIMDAIKRANALGVKMQRVVGFVRPNSAANNGRLILICEDGNPKTGCDTPWWER